MNKEPKYEIEIEGKRCRLTEMSRVTLEVAMGLIMNAVPQYIRAGEIILRNSWVDGDMEILENESLLIGASMKAFELINIKQAVLKKI